jgi:hypothetical protein
LISRARYSAERIGDDVIALTDLDRGRSITNDAEQVVATLREHLGDLDRFRIIYRDSEGRWDGIATIRSHFVGFVPLRCDNLDRAITVARRREPWGPR